MSGEPVSYQPWAPGQPNGGRHQACAEAKIDRETFQGYNDLNCAKSTRCFTCNIKSQQRSELQAGQTNQSVDFQIYIERTGGEVRPEQGGHTLWYCYQQTVWHEQVSHS